METLLDFPITICYGEFVIFPAELDHPSGRGIFIGFLGEEMSRDQEVLLKIELHLMVQILWP